MKHHTPLFFRDDYGIGQAALARIQEEVAGKQMLQVCGGILTTSYADPVLLASNVRMLNAAMPGYRKAQAVKEMLQSEVVQ